MQAAVFVRAIPQALDRTCSDDGMAIRWQTLHPYVFRRPSRISIQIHTTEECRSAMQ
jgi:hypothetical protein